MEDEYINDECDNDNIDNTFIMYKICPKNKDLNFCYVGHTTNFTKRKRDHIKNTTNQNDKKHYHLKHYETIRNNGGWDEWEMTEIEHFKCKTKLEARIREQQLIEKYNANLNSLKAHVTEEEKQQTKKMITEKYRIENKAKIREQEKIYKQEHKDIIAEQMKKYRQENKDKLREQTKEYRIKNKEKYDQQQKEYREKNKEILKEKRKIYEAKRKQQRLEEKMKAEQSNTILEQKENNNSI